MILQDSRVKILEQLTKWLGIIDRNHRFIFPILLVVLAKVLASSILYARLGNFPGTPTPGVEVLSEGNDGSWVNIFHGWDSYLYLKIARDWYSESSLYAFFPLYPILTRLFSLGIVQLKYSAFFVSFFLGLASVPLFQSVAENYMDQNEALGCTIIIFFFPHVFFFTTIAYSESLFLFATLSSWLLYLRGRSLLANVSASLATLTRPYGILIVMPILFGLLSKREWRKLLYVAIPAASLFGWMLHCLLATGDWLVFLTQQLVGPHATTWTGLFDNFVNFLNFYNYQIYKLADFTYTIALTALTFCLITLTFRIDWRIGSFSLATFLVFLLFGALISFVRFVSFIFPIWLILRVRNPLTLVSIVILFFISSLMVWNQFLVGGWIG